MAIGNRRQVFNNYVIDLRHETWDLIFYSRRLGLVCGIIGYVGNDTNATKKIIEGLKNLEYRGYDSAGIAIIEDGKLIRHRAKGKIKKLSKR